MKREEALFEHYYVRSMRLIRKVLGGYYDIVGPTLFVFANGACDTQTSNLLHVGFGSDGSVVGLSKIEKRQFPAFGNCL